MGCSCKRSSFDPSADFYLIEIVYEVVLQKSIPTQTRQLILYIGNKQNQLWDLCGNWLSQNDCINTFCKINLQILSLTGQLGSILRLRVMLWRMKKTVICSNHSSFKRQLIDKQVSALALTCTAAHSACRCLMPRVAWARCPVNPSPYTLHPQPYTLHSTSYTLHLTWLQAQSSNDQMANTWRVWCTKVAWFCRIINHFRCGKGQVLYRVTSLIRNTHSCRIATGPQE